MDKRPFSVLIGFEPDRYLRREVLRGLLDHQRRSGGWNSVHLLHGDVSPRVLTSFRHVDGMVMTLRSGPRTQAMYRKLLAWGKPVVLVASPRELCGLPAVHEDDQAIGEMAAEHLLGQGFRQFYAVGWRDLQYSTRRIDAFLSAVTRRGASAKAKMTVVRNRRPTNMRSVEAHWHRWIRTLSLPAGVFVADQTLAREFAFAAATAGVTVPEQMAILSATEEPLSCTMSPVPLSAIDGDLFGMGFEAGRLMHQMLAGKKWTGRPVLMPPRGVVVRRSTEALAIEDVDLASAIRWARENALSAIRVKDVLKVVPIGRRALERGFRRTLGRTVMEEVARVRLDRARKLLAETDMDLWSIAERCGFGHRSRLYAHFEAALNQTPVQYRRQFARHGGVSD